MRRFYIVTILLFVAAVCAGCTGKKDYGEKVRDLEFTVVTTSDIPKELMQIIDQEKNKEFHLTYGTDDFLYICVGYGEMKSGGYSISVDDLYLTSQVIYIDTNLIGPAKGETVTQMVSTPYIVVKIEYCDNTVVFN